MGIRPQMHVVFGVDDFFGEIPIDIYETQLFISDEEIKAGPHELAFLKDAFFDLSRKEWQFIYDRLYVGSEWNPGVLGMSIFSSDFDSDLVRALSIFHERYETSGKRDLPVWKPEDHQLYATRIETGHVATRSCADIEFQWSWFYPSVIEMHTMWPVRAYQTRWLLQQVGIEIDYHRYKAMLVWQWK